MSPSPTPAPSPAPGPGPSPARQERPLSALLLALALGCGAFALWPVLLPGVRAPTVTREALPLPVTAAAPVYPATASITPLISGLLNLNTASEEQIEALPGVGPAMAGRITAARPLHTLADLDAVRGVGPSLLGKLTPLVKFGP